METFEEFRVKSVIRSERHKAARLAVLKPIFGWKKASTDDVDSLNKTYTDLRRVWAKRIYSLAKAGCHWIESDNHQRFLLNCVPFGVETSTFSRSCKRRFLCPFCWGRSVSQSFRHIEIVLDFLEKGEKISHKALPKKYRLIAFRRKTRIWCPEEPNVTPRVLNQVLLPNAREALKTQRLTEIRLFRPFAGVINHAFWFADNSLKFCRAGVLVCPEGLGPTQSLPPSTWTFEKPSPILKSDLRIACAKALAYPAELLRNKAENVLTLLEGLRNKRLLSYHGGIRSFV